MKIKKYLDYATDEQKETLKQLERLIEKETQFAKQDINLWDQELQKKVINTKAEIKSYMIKAVEQGMGKLDYINNNYETYVGEPIPKH